MDSTRRTSSTLRYVIEITVIVGALLLFTAHHRDYNPTRRTSGDEFSYLINSGYIAADIFQEYGTIPLWNPLMGRGGEPLVENPFSFVLNPLMTAPMLIQGGINGAKTAVSLHFVLTALGGWLLAYTLGLRTPGRLLAAFVLGSSSSMIAAIADGFFQMSLSQAYMPWVYAGLIGILREGRRWQVGVFVLATTLMIFAGTFWYLLPTALMCALLVMFFTLEPDAYGDLHIRWRVLGRVVWAGLLLLGLAAVRLLPQIVHRDFVFHPPGVLNLELGFLEVFQLYFRNIAIGEIGPNYLLYYHYTLPVAFVLLLVVTRLFVLRVETTPRWRWRVIVPALLLIAFVTVWAQEKTLLFEWLYEQSALLREWRFVGRVMGAGSVWVGMIGAIWFDDLVAAAGALRWRRVAQVATVALLLVGGLTALEVNRHWWRAGLMGTEHFHDLTLRYLRALNRGPFLSVRTPSFFRYLAHYETRSRAWFGNPDYRPLGLPNTIGRSNVLNYPAQYFLGIEGRHIPHWRDEVGYRAVPRAPSPFEHPNLWVHPTTPDYAFIASEEMLGERSERRFFTDDELDRLYLPLQRDETLPVRSYEHRFDSIALTASNYPRDAVLVVSETAYPGWRVTVDGQSVPLEVVDGSLAVRLPRKPTDALTRVAFVYRPTWLYIGGGITLVTAVIYAAYLLRAVWWLRWLSNPDRQPRPTDTPIPAPRRSHVPPRTGQRTPVYILLSVYVTALVLVLLRRRS